MADNTENKGLAPEEITEETAAEAAAEAVEASENVKDAEDTTAEAAAEENGDDALSRFLSREQEEQKPVKQSKINKKLLIPIIAAVVVAALVCMLIFMRTHTPKGATNDESLLPAKITTDVNDKGVHEAQVAVDENGEILQNGSGKLLEYVPADIKEIGVENEKGTFSVLADTPEGGSTTFTLVGFEGVTLQAGIADEVASAVTSLDFLQVVSADADFADYGLDKPKAIAAVKYTDGTSAVIRVGNDAAANAGTYFAFGSGKAVYLAQIEKFNPLIDITKAAESSDDNKFSELTITGSCYPDAITLVPNEDEAIEASYIVTEPKRMFANAVEGNDITGSVRGLYAEEVVCVHPSSGQLADYGIAEPYAKVSASYPDTDMTEIYDAIDGEVTYIGTLDYYDDQALPYDVFRALPCMIQVNADSARNSVNNPADGRFFGDIEAAAIDGSYLLLNIGDPLIISEEEYNSLNVGDVIDTPVFGDGQQGMTVTAIDESNGYRTVELDGRDDYWFVQHPYSEDDTDYILETYSDNPVLFNYRLCPVPLASDCEVTDQYAALFSDSDTEAFNNWNPGPDANALTSSSYWFYENVNTTDVPEPVHGWIPANGLAYPLTIENGELTSINIEWR